VGITIQTFTQRSCSASPHVLYCACRWRSGSCCHWKQDLSRGGAHAVPKVFRSIPLPTALRYRDIPPAMPFDGPGRTQEPVAPLSPTPLVNALSDVLPGTNRRKDIARQPTIPPAVQNKAEARPASPSSPVTPSPFVDLYRDTHARVIVGSEASTISSSSELTSPSGDSLPSRESGAHTRQQNPTSKQPRNQRRPKKTPARWSRNTASSDDTGSDGKASLSSSSKQYNHNAASSSQASSPLRQRPPPNLATHNAAGFKGRLMAANFGANSGDARRGVSSPRPKGRGTKVWFVH
jgi:hypothetical protein